MATLPGDPALAALLRQVLERDDNRAAFAEIDGLPADLQLRITAGCTVAVVPGAFWVENPGTGADAHFIIEALARAGCPAERIVVPSLGTLDGNATVIRDWLRARPAGERVVLVTISKGSCDVRHALGAPDAAVTFARVTGWVNLSGPLFGSEIPRLLSASAMARASLALKSWYWGYSPRGILELGRAPGEPLARPFAPPAHIRMVHVVGFPQEADLTLPMARQGHRRLARFGPNDGFMQLEDVVRFPGIVYPLAGADHFLRSLRAGSDLVPRLVRFVAGGGAGDAAGPAGPATAPSAPAPPVLPPPRPGLPERLDARAPADMPIPEGLNRALVVGVCAAAVLLLGLASHVFHPVAFVAVAIAFSYVMLCCYAVLHEATHDNLQSDPRLNYWGGFLTAALFPAPFTMLRVHHRGHHLRNRTDFEMFDLYDPGDSMFMKYLLWYGTLLGAVWPSGPALGALFAVWPGVLRSKVLIEYRPYRHYLRDIQAPEIRSIRLEMLAIVAFFGLATWLLQLRLAPTLLLYGCFALNWSTRQYIGHAFSRRDVAAGAFNLEHNRLMMALMLNGPLDLNHHRHPDVPWIHLPRLTRPDEPMVPYTRQYLRMWLGPRANLEPAPEALRPVPISVHEVELSPPRPS